MAGSLVTQTTYYHDQQPGKNAICVRKLAVLSDAADGTVPVTTLSGILGYQLIGVETIPGAAAAAPDAYIITFANELGTTILSVPTRSTTLKEFFDAAATLGQYPIIVDGATIAIGNLGNANTIDVYLHFIK